jgi:MFS family permease
MTPWIAGAGAFLVSLDSMVNIAFPAMATAFALPPDAMRWVIMCYVFTYAVLSFVGGAVADRIGHGRVFSVGVSLTAVAFIVAASASAFGWLLAGRVLQGVGAGMIYGTAPALAALAVDASARRRALGFLNAAIGAAFAIGPLLAGVLVEAFGWRAVFAARLPVALIVLAWAWRGLARARAAAISRAMDAEHLARAPVLHACALAFLANAGIFAIWLLAPFYLLEHRGYPARAGGLLFMLTPLGTAIASLGAGRLADRLGHRVPGVLGLLIEAGGLLLLSGATRATPVEAVAMALLAAGFGLGLFQVPNMSAVMGEFSDRQQGAGGGLAFMARTLGVVAGVAALSHVFASRRAGGFEPAFAAAFLVAGAAVVIAATAACVPVRRKVSR